MSSDATAPDAALDRADPGRALRGLRRALDQAATSDRDSAPREASDPPLAGLPLVRRLTALLLAQRCGWADIVTDDPVLAKICGRFGSAFPAEQEAAYIHALRHLRRRRSSWQSVLRVPAVFGAAVPGMAAAAAASTTPSRAPPEDTWLATVEGLLARAIWHDESERLRLARLAARASADDALDDVDAEWVRDLWWDAEVRAPSAAVSS